MVRLAEPRMVTTWPLAEKVCQPLPLMVDTQSQLKAGRIQGQGLGGCGKTEGSRLTKFIKHPHIPGTTLVYTH